MIIRSTCPPTTCPTPSTTRWATSCATSGSTLPSTATRPPVRSSSLVRAMSYRPLNLSRDVGADDGFAKWWPINGNNVRWPEDYNTYRLTVKPTVRTLYRHLPSIARHAAPSYITHTHTHTQRTTHDTHRHTVAGRGRSASSGTPTASTPSTGTAEHVNAMTRVFIFVHFCSFLFCQRPSNITTSRPPCSDSSAS